MYSAFKRTVLIGALVGLVCLGISFSNGSTYQSDPPAFQSDDPPSVMLATIEPPSAYIEKTDFDASEFAEVPSLVGPMKADCGCSQGKPCTCNEKDCVCPECLAVGCGKAAARRAARRQGGDGGDSGGDQGMQMQMITVADPTAYSMPVANYNAGVPVGVPNGYTYTDVNNNTWTYSCGNGMQCGWMLVATTPTATVTATAAGVTATAYKSGDKCPCCGMEMTKEQIDRMNAKPKTATPIQQTVPVAVPPMYQPTMYQPMNVGSYGGAMFTSGGCGAGSSACSGGNCGTGRGFGIFRRR